MMKRKVALLMTTVMLATSVFPAGITAYAEEAVPTSEVAVEATLDETLEESADTSAVDGDVNVPDENAGTEADAAQTGEDVMSAEDEMIADDMTQEVLTEEDSQGAPIVADGDVIVSDVEVVDEVSTISTNESEEEDSGSESEPIELEAGVPTTYKGNIGKYYYFIPSVDDDYTIISFGEHGVDPDIDVLDILDSNDSWGGNTDFYNNNFKMSKHLEASKVYRFYVYAYHEDEEVVEESFVFGIYNTSDITPSSIGIEGELETMPDYINGIDSISSYFTNVVKRMTFSYGSGENEKIETVGISDIFDANYEDEAYRDEYYNSITCLLNGNPLGDYVYCNPEALEETNTLIVKIDDDVDDDGERCFYSLGFNAKDVSEAAASINGNVIELSDAGNTLCYEYRVETLGDYVFRRTKGQTIYVIPNEDIENPNEWKSKPQAWPICDASEGDVYYIVIPNTQGGQLTIGEPKGISSIDFVAPKVDQNVSEVFANGLEYSLKINYDGDEEIINSLDYWDYLCGDSPSLQAGNGVDLELSYLYKNNPVNLTEAVPIGNLIVQVSYDDLSTTQEFNIKDDFADAAAISESGQEVTAENHLFKILDIGTYRLQYSSDESVTCYYLKNNMVYNDREYWSGETLQVDSSKEIYIDATNIIGSKISTVRVTPIKSVSIASHLSTMQFVEGKTCGEIKERSNISVKIEYDGAAPEIVPMYDEDSYGNYVGCYILKAKGNQPDYDDDSDYFFEDVIPAGSYFLIVYVDWENEIVLPFTVVHDWGAWTTSKKADIYSPETQTSKCAHCGTIGTRTIGSKLAPVLTLTANKLTMKTKQSTSKFKVEAMAAGDALASVTSNNTKLLKVSNVNPNGTFKLKAQNKTGTAKLTITLKSGASKTIKVKIQKAKVKTTKIKVASKKLTLSKKQKYNLATVVTPVTSYDKVKYTSSNKKVATVSKKGQVTAKNKGSATITVKSGKKSVKVKVTVK